jgi:DNA primase
MAVDAIEEIKERIDLVSEIGTVVALRRSGKAYKGLCPFHNERTPSFYVFPETRTWRCFGCNEGGDVFTFFSRYQNLDFRDVLTMLAEKAGVDLGAGSDFAAGPTPQDAARARLRAMNDAAAVWFHHQLLTSTAANYARSYLQSRGIANETIERFRLGYAPDGDTLAKYLIEQGYGEDELVEAGLARRREGETRLYDYFRNRVIFTIRDTRDHVVGFGARELGGGTPKYLNSPQTILFDKSAVLYGLDLAREAIRRQDEVVIVEGYVDAVIAHQYGFRNTVACIGSAITPRHVQQIKKMTRRLVLALDPDAAGEAATLRAIEVAQESFDREMVPVPLPPDPATTAPRGKRKRNEAPAGMVRFEEQVNAEIRILQLPDGIDPDEYIRADATAWQRALDAALPLMDFYFATMTADLDLRQAADQAEAARRLLPVLATVADRVKQDAYVRRLAGMTRVPERDLALELRQQRRLAVAKKRRTDAEPDPDPLGDKSYDPAGQIGPEQRVSSQLSSRMRAGLMLEEECIGLLLNHLQVAAEACAILLTSDFWGTLTQPLFTLIAAQPFPILAESLQDVLATQPEVLQHEANRLRSRFDATDKDVDRAHLARTAKQLAYRLRRLRLSDAITELSYLQREADEQHDGESSRLLLSQAQRLTMERLKLDSAQVVQT